MEERDFWFKLWRRIQEEIYASDREDLQGFSSDWMDWDSYVLHQTPPRLRGVILLGVGGHESWRYVLHLSGLGEVRSVDDIEWQSLLPDERRTGWLTANIEKKLLEIDPTVAEVPEADLLLESDGSLTVIARDGSSPEPNPMDETNLTFVRRIRH